MLLTKDANFKENQSCAECFMLISNKTTFAQIVLHKLYLKQQIEEPLILLTTKTNLGKFTVARPFSHKV